MVIINSFRHPESPIRLQQTNVQALLDKKDLGVGTLYISESTLCWNLTDDFGFSIGYQDITLHAVSRDPNVNDRDCLYIIVDNHFGMPGEELHSEDEHDSDCESNPDITELVLVPENPLSLESWYDTVRICQELNPDPNDMDEDDDDYIFEDAEDEFDAEVENFYLTGERGGGDAEVEDLSRQLERNAMERNFANGSNGNNNDDDEFEDAD